MNEFKHRYCKSNEALEALWDSVQHWANLCTGEEIHATADACALCRMFFDGEVEDSYQCHECPISEVACDSHCSRTPYYAATKSKSISESYWTRVITTYEAALREYQFLLALALEEDVTQFILADHEETVIEEDYEED